MVGRVFNCRFILYTEKGGFTLLQLILKSFTYFCSLFGIAREVSQKNGEAYEGSVGG